jgi:choloylglycine hydrolase
LSSQQVKTLSSLQQVDDFPLYTMRYFGSYESAMQRNPFATNLSLADRTPFPLAWACSLFAALADPESQLYGRNFDWRYSPTLLLFADPSDGYSSVSMVDIDYLGFGGANAQGLTDLPLLERRSLLDAPYLPFDGMNEQGLVIGMAAVPSGNVPRDPSKETLDSLMVIREILDHAESVNDAVAILQSFNIDWSGGPPLHYLIADASGNAVLVEFYAEEMITIPNDGPWHQATNFLHAAVGESTEGECWRYDKIHEKLSAEQGQITPEEAMGLLAAVAQDTTQWSVVYEQSTGNVNVALGRAYKDVHSFDLDFESD